MKWPKENLKEKVSNGWSLGSINISRLGREVSEEQPERKEEIRKWCPESPQ